MKSQIVFRNCLLWVLIACSLGMTAPLSYAKIKNLYKEGEFEQIRVSLESFLKQNEKTAQIKEKIFAYKYLGVIYAAQSDGATIATSYFYQLLKLAPNAHISDLYVSTAIEDLFEKTQARYQKEIRENSEYDEFGNPRVAPAQGNAIPPKGVQKDTLSLPTTASTSNSASNDRKSPSKETKIWAWPWVVGSAAIAVVGGVWWYASQESDGKKTIYSVKQ